jgi:O-antigen/teichoic acid export membrane protein
MNALPVLVAQRLSPAENAYSSVTWMSAGFFFMASSAVATSLFAEGSHARRTLPDGVRAGAGIIATLLVPAILISALAGERLLAVFGAAYARHGASLLLVLAVAAIPDAITNLAVGVWRVQGRLTVAALLNVGMAGLSLMLAWLWLPHLGILGAGVAWLVGQSAGSVAVLVVLLSAHLGRSSVRRRMAATVDAVAKCGSSSGAAPGTSMEAASAPSAAPGMPSRCHRGE